MSDANEVYLVVRDGKRHLAAQFPGGPLLTSEACNLDQVGQRTIYGMDDPKDLTAEPCEICLVPVRKARGT
jgi:hypothetical protein